MSVVGQITHAQIVLPNDTSNLRRPSMWLSFTNSGVQTITIDTVGDATGNEVNVTLTLPSGLYPISAKRVYATGTTVTNIVEYWV